MRKLFLFIVGCLAASPVLADQVTVTLAGGAKITATLLRENNEGVVLDLGHDVLSIPAKRVLNVDRHDGPSAEASKKEEGVFTTGRLEAADVPALPGSTRH